MGCSRECPERRSGCQDRCIKQVAAVLVAMEEKEKVRKENATTRALYNHKDTSHMKKPKAFKRKSYGGSKSET